MNRSKEIFAQIIDLDVEEREAALIELSGSDPELLDDVRELLDGFEEKGGLLDAPLFSAPGRLRPGERLGPYVIESLAGHGGSGEVYRARRAEGGSDVVALKILAREDLGETERKRFLRESRAVESCRHPSLVEVLEAGEDATQGLLYYVMRFVEGPNLAQVLDCWSRGGYRPNREDRRQIVRVLEEVGQALQCMHEAGLVHGDVKPANIVLEGASLERPWQSGSRAVLVDLGLVRPQGKVLSTIRATPSYASLEQWEGEELDGRTDIYSLGVTAHDLVSGRTPDRRTGLPRGKPRELEPLESLVPEVEEGLSRIVLVATEPKRRTRYASMARMLADWAAWREGRSIAAGRFALLRDLRRWMRLHPGQALRGGAVLAVSLVLLAVFLGAFLDTVSRAQAIESAWSAGDLPGFRARFTASTWLPIEWLIEGSIVSRGRALSSGDSEDVVVQVMSVFDAEGELSAFRRAAAILERDGVTAHPELLRFLSFHWRNGEERPAKTALMARLFYDHPLESRAERSASRFLGDQIWAVVRDPRTNREGHEALTILAGWGELKDLFLLNAWIFGFFEGGQESVETGLAHLESTLRAETEILRRGRGLGRHHTWPKATLQRYVRELLDLYQACEQRSGRRLDLNFGFNPLYRVAAVYARDRFPEVVRDALPQGEVYQHALILATLKDDEHRSVLLSDLPHDLTLPRQAGPEIANRVAVILHSYGQQVAAYGDEELVAAARRRAAAFGHNGAISPRRSVELFEVGLQDGQLWLEDHFRPHLPDAGTHLGDELKVIRRDPAVDAHALEWPIPAEVRPFELGWDFIREAVRLSAGCDVWTENTVLMSDEAAAQNTSHQRLLNPGVSQVVLSMPRQTFPICIHLNAQKSQRWPLYQTGIANLEIFQNEPLIATIRVGQRSEHIVRAFPDGHPDDWILRIRLSADSTTTARLHRVWIHINHRSFNQPCQPWPDEEAR